MPQNLMASRREKNGEREKPLRVFRDYRLKIAEDISPPLLLQKNGMASAAPVLHSGRIVRKRERERGKSGVAPGTPEAPQHAQRAT
jgi:hypothetical protein